MPLILLPTACAAAAAAVAPASALAAFSRPKPSRIRASHLLFAFPRLRKYGRRDREPVTTSFDEEEAEEDEEYGEEVEEDAWLEKRPKPVGFGAGRTYSTDIEERLLQEMGLGGARRRSEPALAKHRAAANSAKETGLDLSNDGVHVRLWNLPKKKNIHKDLKLAFKGFPGLITINPAVSANKKTRDPICKGFAYLKLESVEAATRFVELYSSKTVSFGKVQKPIRIEPPKFGGCKLNDTLICQPVVTRTSGDRKFPEGVLHRYWRSYAWLKIAETASNKWLLTSCHPDLQMIGPTLFSIRACLDRHGSDSISFR